MNRTEQTIAKTEAVAENGMVTAMHPLAAEAGVAILHAGGSAADAAVATALAVGFARYSAIAGFREFVVLRATRPQGFDPGERVVSPQEVDDPWNLWVFNVGGRGNFSGTDTRKTTRISYNFWH